MRSLAASSPQLLGWEFVVTGKVSVGGNSRSRSFRSTWGLYSIGRLAHSAVRFGCQVRTLTGCLGVWMGFWF
jgi:urease accessory protein UreH